MEHTDDDFELPDALTATQAKNDFRTHFDEINEQIQALKVAQGEQVREYTDLFENSNAQTDAHKAFILENDQQRIANVTWAKTSFEKYESMMDDFKGYKRQTNDLFSKMSK